MLVAICLQDILECVRTCSLRPDDDLRLLVVLYLTCTWVSCRVDLRSNVIQNSDFCPIPFFTWFYSRAFVRIVAIGVFFAPATVNGDVDSALDRGDDGSRLTANDASKAPPGSVIAFCQYDGDRLDVWRFGRTHLHGELVELPDDRDL